MADKTRRAQLRSIQLGFALADNQPSRFKRNLLAKSLVDHKLAWVGEATAQLPSTHAL
jgi:hypothetical protein